VVVCGLAWSASSADSWKVWKLGSIAVCRHRDHGHLLKREMTSVCSPERRAEGMMVDGAKGCVWRATDYASLRHARVGQRSALSPSRGHGLSPSPFTLRGCLSPFSSPSVEQD
jgi:hypothetical protein